ncbi:hypothetical protein FFLO_03580 [Filobasidium floriforme]|uniref:Uncharacterized protein n=1 Tax=Filobasidium floriforme TaxID=5210 RepID=A0A8K0JLU0_9TREE|nr:hypothetical protein FFLO_03580 [Filobasidium floriforme]
MPRRSPRHVANISGATDDSVAETSLAETQPSEGSFRTEEGTRPESTQGQSAASTGTLRRNPRRQVRDGQPEGHDTNSMDIRDSGASMSHTSQLSVPGFSKWTSFASFSLRGPPAQEESRKESPDWFHWCEHREDFLRHYDLLSPLMVQLAAGPGPMWTVEGPNRGTQWIDTAQRGVVDDLNKVFKAAQDAVRRMQGCEFRMEHEENLVRASANRASLAVIMQKAYEEFVLLAKMKGFEFAPPRSATAPRSANSGGQDQQSASGRAQPDVQPDATRSDHEDSDEEMPTA